jgi:outer membrane receptor protein involved in Fe transport
MRLFRTGLALTGLAMVGSIGTAYAAATPVKDSGALEEVVVTAQKRVQNLKDVPISVIVATGESLARQNITTLEDFSTRLANVYVAKGTISDSLTIRGVGSGNNAGFEQSVATFVDGVYHGRARYTRGNFVDLARVEVLRGPQSTYFGNNAIGGAFSITTRRPGKEWEGDASASYEFVGQELVTDVAVGGPLSDTVGIRVATHYSDLGGWLKNLSSGDRNPGVKDKFGRITLDWQPNEDWTVVLKGEFGKQDAVVPAATQLTNCPPAAPFTPSGACTYALALGTETLTDKRRSGIPGAKGSLENREVALTVERHGDGVGLFGQVAYSKYNMYTSGDPSGIPVPFFGYNQDESYDQTSFELRLTSPDDSKLKYIAGVYGIQNHLNTDSSISLEFLTPIISFLETLPPQFGGLPPGILSALTPLGLNVGLLQKETAYSAFGAVTWPFTDQLSATVGARWTTSDKSGTSYGKSNTNHDPFANSYTEITGTAFGGFLDLQSFASAFTGMTKHTTSSKIKDSAFLPSVSVQYKATDDMSLYGSYSKGFKAGGFDSSETTGLVENMSYDPESVRAFEVGAKSVWLNGRLSVNVAVFDSQYSDLQNAAVQFTDTTTFIKVTNAGALSTRGVELDAAWRLNDVWRLGVNVATLDAKFKNYPNAGCTVLQIEATPVGCTQDLSGKSPAFSPKYSGSARLGAVVPVGSRLQFSGDLVLSFSDSYDLLGTNDATSRQVKWQRWDLRLALGSADGKWEAALVGKNLTDEQTVSLGNNAVATPGSYAALVDRGRQVAIQARYKW